MTVPSETGRKLIPHTSARKRIIVKILIKDTFGIMDGEKRENQGSSAVEQLRSGPRAVPPRVLKKKLKYVNVNGRMKRKVEN